MCFKSKYLHLLRVARVLLSFSIFTTQIIKIIKLLKTDGFKTGAVSWYLEDGEMGLFQFTY